MMQVNILIIEDEPFTAKLITDFLISYDKIRFGVSEASTLASACSQVRIQDLDVIILDLNLPNSPWYNTLPAIQKVINETSKIIALVGITGDINIKYSEIAIYGVTELVYKPFDIAKLIEESVLLGALSSLSKTEEKIKQRNQQAREMIKNFYAGQSN